MTVKRKVTIEIGDNPSFGDLYSIPLADWLAMPTLAVGQEANLKYDGARYRVWTGRSHPSDWPGNPQGYTDSRLQFEELVDGRWISLDRYGKRKDR